MPSRMKFRAILRMVAATASGILQLGEDASQIAAPCGIRRAGPPPRVSTLMHKVLHIAAGGIGEALVIAGAPGHEREGKTKSCAEKMHHVKNEYRLAVKSLAGISDAPAEKCIAPMQFGRSVLRELSRSVKFPPFIVANPKRILFVCTGNICRSPMAEGLLRHAAQRRGDISVASAGVATGHGQPASENSVVALRQWDIDIRGIRSQPLTDELIEWATHIFAMTRSHMDAILTFFPEAEEKVWLACEFTPDLADNPEVRRAYLGEA